MITHLLWHIIAGHAAETYDPCPLVENQCRLVGKIHDTGADQIVQPPEPEGHMPANGSERMDLNATIDVAKGPNYAGELCEPVSRALISDSLIFMNEA